MNDTNMESFTMEDLIRVSREMFIKDSARIRDYGVKVRDPISSTIKLKILEFHENSIVTTGWTKNTNHIPSYVTFSKRGKHKELKVVDSMVTPEIAILYFSTNPKKYQKCKKAVLKFYWKAQGIFTQMESYQTPFGELSIVPDINYDK